MASEPSRLFREFVHRFPKSFLNEQYVRFEGKGFEQGLHGEFARAMWMGDIMDVCRAADAPNQEMLMVLLFHDIYTELQGYRVDGYV